MIWLAHYDKLGRYTWFGNASLGIAPAPAPGLYIGERVDPLCQYHDLIRDLPVTMPPRPDAYHDFDYTRKQWVANPEAAWASIRQQRARLLAGSDWLVTKAAESGQLVPPEWVAYRQALRDITLQADPWAIVWPVMP